jgi:hypothetical protein
MEPHRLGGDAAWTIALVTLARAAYLRDTERV